MAGRSVVAAGHGGAGRLVSGGAAVAARGAVAVGRAIAVRGGAVARRARLRLRLLLGLRLRLLLGLRLRLAPLLAQPLQPAFEDLADQVAVLDPRRLRDQAQVRITGGEAGQRVDLDDVDVALGGHAQVDARDVAAAERGEGLAAHALDRFELRGRHLRRALVADVLL